MVALDFLRKLGFASVELVRGWSRVGLIGETNRTPMLLALTMKDPRGLGTDKVQSKKPPIHYFNTDSFAKIAVIGSSLVWKSSSMILV